MQLTIAGAQIPVADDVATNVETITRAIEYAAVQGADILLTPEGSLSGYHDAFDLTEVRSALDHVVSLAASKHVGLALGTCFEEADGAKYNQLRFYDQDGGLLGWHAKILRCSSWQDPDGAEVARFATRPLETFTFKGITVGGLVCNDLWANPGCTTMPDTHLSHQLAAMGARIIFHAVNGWRDGSTFTQHHQRVFHEANVMMRASSGPVWIASVDNAAPLDLDTSTVSGLMSPHGWHTTLPARGEQYFCATVELG